MCLKVGVVVVLMGGERQRNSSVAADDGGVGRCCSGNKTGRWLLTAGMFV